MNKCIICGEKIKIDHVYCINCYNKLDKSEAIKKCRKHYSKDNEVTVFDNYNNSLKYFPSINSFQKHFIEANINDFKIEKKPSLGSENVLDILNEKKQYLNGLNLKMEYSSLSYIDSLWALNEAFNLVEDEYIKENTSIYMEYLIPNLEQERIDYILVCNNKMLFIEFGQSDSVELDELSKTKQKQLNRYIRAMKKEFPELKRKNIITEIFVYKSSEYSIKNSIEHLSKMINIHLKDKMPSDYLNSNR